MQNDTSSDTFALDNELVSPSATGHSELSDSRLNTQLDSQPLLPRSAWQDRQALVKVLIRAKKSLDIAEITAFLS